MNFKENNTDTDRLDYAIMRDGGISLYYKKSFLHSDLEWFEKEKYNVISFDCSKWDNEKRMHEHLKERLYFPDYYGMNFSALDDCLSDFEITQIGQVIVFENLDSLKRDLVTAILDTFVRASREKMLFGHRLIILAQVDEPHFEIGKIGGFTPAWNGKEWFNDSRK